MAVRILDIVWVWKDQSKDYLRDNKEPVQHDIPSEEFEPEIFTFERLLCNFTSLFKLLMLHTYRRGRMRSHDYY